jgi:hypothetical protein
MEGIGHPAVGVFSCGDRPTLFESALLSFPVLCSLLWCLDGSDREAV